MQTKAWYFIEPNGTRHGPCFTEVQAQIEAGRFAAGRPDLEENTALTVFRSLAKARWRVRDTKMRAEMASQVPKEH